MQTKKLQQKFVFFFQSTKNHDLDDTLNDAKSITKNFFDTNLWFSNAFWQTNKIPYRSSKIPKFFAKSKNSVDFLIAT